MEAVRVATRFKHIAMTVMVLFALTVQKYTNASKPLRVTLSSRWISPSQRYNNVLPVYLIPMRLSSITVVVVAV